MSTPVHSDGLAAAASNVVDGWKRLDVVLGIALTALLLAARVVAYTHAGALWRDEVHSVNMATHPADFETWLDDSFPVLWLLVLRSWIAMGLGASDLALRCLGLVCGLLHVVALWWCGRQLGSRVPWVLLLLLGLHPTLVIYGDEVRRYGLAVLTQLLLVGATWRWVERPTWARLAVLQLAALLAVQAAYANSFVVLAAFAGAGLVCLRRRHFRTLIALTVAGLVSAASVAPYLLYVVPLGTESLNIVRREVPWDWHVGMFQEALDTAGPVTWLVWALFVELAVGAAVFVAWRDRAVASRDRGMEHRGRHGGDAAAADRAWFLLGNITVGTLGFWWYIRSLKLPTQVWYYLPFMTLLAVCIELACQFASWTKSWMNAGRLAAIVAVFAMMIGSAWPALAFRFTNVDLLAQVIAEDAKGDDLVVVFPWYVGLTYQRYDRGAAPSMNFPDVERARQSDFTGYREMKAKMQQEDPIRGELQQIEQTLRQGGRVWVLGDLDYPRPSERISRLTPAPDPQYGWSEEAYTKYWWRQTSRLLRSSRTIVRKVNVRAEARVNPFEDIPLYVVEMRRK